MITITETKTLYTYGELSDGAKEKAYYKWCVGNEYLWADDNTKTLKAFTSVFDFLDVRDWEYDAYNTYYRFEIDTPYEWEDGDLQDLKGVKLYKFIQNYLVDFMVYKTYSVNGKERKSKISWEYQNNCQLTGYYLDCEIMHPIFKYLSDFHRMQDVTLYELMDECMSAWIQACRNDCRYCESEEYFLEETNDHNLYYYEDGTLYGSVDESEVA